MDQELVRKDVGKLSLAGAQVRLLLMADRRVRGKHTKEPPLDSS